MITELAESGVRVAPVSKMTTGKSRMSEINLMNFTGANVLFAMSTENLQLQIKKDGKRRARNYFLVCVLRVLRVDARRLLFIELLPFVHGLLPSRR